MKKRIISLLLAVVMLFSCLSLNIFATDNVGEGEGASAQAETTHTTDEQRLAIIKANTKIGRLGGVKYSWGNGETGGSMNNDSTRLQTINGHYVVGARTNASATGNEHYIQFSGHSDYAGRDSIAYYAQTPLKGATFTVAVDFEFTEEFIGKTEDGTPNTSNSLEVALIQTAFYLTNTGGSNGGLSQMGTYMPNLLSLRVTGEKVMLRACDAGSYRDVIELNVNTNYSIAITVDPTDNPGTDKYGSFSVYVNGEIVGHRYGFMHATHNAQSTFSTENPRAYFLDSSFNNSKQFLGGKAYFFVPEGTVLDVITDTDEDGIPDIYENVTGITAESAAKITGYECIGTCQGAKDMVLGFVRINQMSFKTYYEADAIYIDNIGVYYGEYADLNSHQYIAGEHTHNYEAGTAEVTFTCACGDVKTETVTFDTNNDRICDLCLAGKKLGAHDYAPVSHVHDKSTGLNNITFECSVCGKSANAELGMIDLEPGKVLSPTEVRDLAGAANTMAYGSDGWCGLGYSTGGRTDPLITQHTDAETGEKYIKYSLPTTAGTGGTYVHAYNSGFAGGWDTALKNFTKWVGKSYVATIDIMIYGNSYSFKPFQIVSYTHATDGATKIADTITIEPLYVTANGELQYDATGTSSYKSTGITFEPGKFYTVTYHHTPETNSYDVFVNGELVVNDAVALSAAKIAKNTWTSPCDSIPNLDPAYDETAEVVDGVKMFKMEGAKHFTPGFIRLPQISASSVATEGKNPDMYAFDNVKFYYSDVNYDCVHSYVNGACEWCGKAIPAIDHCDLCDGQILSAGAAVTGKSASLGKLIDMNVYMALNNEILNTEGAKVILEAGNKRAEYLLADAKPEENGKYKFALPLSSSQMADEVIVTLVGEETISYSTSIKEYAEELIATSDDAAAVATAKAMLNYAAASQTYFAEKNNDDTLDDILANSGLLEADKTLPSFTAEDFKTHQLVQTGATNEVHFTAMSLVLASKTHIKLYFTASAAATVTVGGVAYNKVADGDEYYITITIDNPSLADDAFDVVITDGETTASAGVSAFTAVYYGLSNTGTNKKLVTLLKYYAEYCNLASEYANNK